MLHKIPEELRPQFQRCASITTRTRFLARSQNGEKQILASSCLSVCPFVHLSVFSRGKTRLPMDEML